MRRLAGITCLLTAAALAAAAPSPALEADYAFRTPGGAIYCGMEFNAQSWTGFVCFRPKNGFFVRMINPLGRRVKITQGFSRGFKGYKNTRVRVWAFGRTWYSSDAEIVTCKSRRTGLTCTHHRGHGWRLGRSRGYTVF